GCSRLLDTSAEISAEPIVPTRALGHSACSGRSPSSVEQSWGGDARRPELPREHEAACDEEHEPGKEHESRRRQRAITSDRLPPQTKLALTAVTGPASPVAGSTRSRTLTRSFPLASRDAKPLLTVQGELALSTPPITIFGLFPARVQCC